MVSKEVHSLKLSVWKSYCGWLKRKILVGQVEHMRLLGFLQLLSFLQLEEVKFQLKVPKLHHHFAGLWHHEFLLMSCRFLKVKRLVHATAYLRIHQQDNFMSLLFKINSSIHLCHLTVDWVWLKSNTKKSERSELLSSSLFQFSQTTDSPNEEDGTKKKLIWKINVITHSKPAVM